MAKIEIEIQANEKDELVGFEQDSITIGRGLGNDILIEDPQVSRYHARLVFEEGSLVLYDLRSRNGTRVNSEKISSCPIKGDEAIMIGAAILKARVNSKMAVSSPEKKDEYRPTKAHYVSSVIEMDDEGQPLETPIYNSDKSTLDLENEPVDPAQVLAEAKSRIVQENVAIEVPKEKDTESALISNDYSEDDPWRPFENCLSGVMPLVRDPAVESVTITSTDNALVKRNGLVERVSVRLTEGQLQEALRIVSASVKPSHSSQASAPAFSIRLADGAELAGAGPALSPPYGVIIISTPPTESLSIQDFVRNKILSQDLFYFLHGCVALRKTILVSGIKPSISQDLLGVLGSCIPASQRITLLRGFSRLRVDQAEVVYFAERMGISAAVMEAASRTRPDRFMVAEPLRGDAVRTFTEQVLNGALGSLAQVVSPSPEATISKLEAAICQSDKRLPYPAVRSMVREAIQVIVQLYELPDGTHRVLSISEIAADENGDNYARQIFKLKQDSSAIDSPHYQHTSPTFLEELELTGFEEAYEIFKK